MGSSRIHTYSFKLGDTDSHVLKHKFADLVGVVGDDVAQLGGVKTYYNYIGNFCGKENYYQNIQKVFGVIKRNGARNHYYYIKSGYNCLNRNIRKTML